MLPGAGATLGQVTSVSIECADCGRCRWRRPGEFYRFGLGAHSPVSELGNRLSCQGCREEGLPGKNIVIQAAFTAIESRSVASLRLRSRAARGSG